MVEMSLTTGFEAVLAGVIVAGILYYCWIVRITRDGGELSRAASYSGYDKRVARRGSSAKSDGSASDDRDSQEIRMTIDMDDYDYRGSCESFADAAIVATPAGRARYPSL